jgi:hypothetical protein
MRIGVTLDVKNQSIYASIGEMRYIFILAVYVVF